MGRKQTDLGDLRPESLASIQIISVSRKEQELAHAAGAIFVITSDDIRRSGLTTLPERLRTVPGVDVAETGTNDHRLDPHAGWCPTRSLEISVAGRNLLQAEHLEFPSGELVQAEPVARSASLEAPWRF
jgi:iron complex outermembrane receptor protein